MFSARWSTIHMNKFFYLFYSALPFKPESFYPFYSFSQVVGFKFQVFILYNPKNWVEWVGWLRLPNIGQVSFDYVTMSSYIFISFGYIYTNRVNTLWYQPNQISKMTLKTEQFSESGHMFSARWSTIHMNSSFHLFYSALPFKPESFYPFYSFFQVVGI